MCGINKIYFDSNFEENQYLSCLDSDRFVPSNFIVMITLNTLKIGLFLD